MRHVRAHTAVLTLLAFASTAPAFAQTTIDVEIAGFSKYVWRGVSITNNPVVQADLALSIPLSIASLNIGAWANIEPLRYDDVNDISQGGGVAAPDVTEFDWRADIARTFSIASITAGATGYQYPNKLGVTSDARTIELYGKLQLDPPSLSLTLSLYYDVDKVRGSYLEGGLSKSVGLTPGFAMTLGALAGWSAGQEVDNDPAANFARSGLTHVDLCVTTDLALGSLSIAPEMHYVINHDDFTRFLAPDYPSRAYNIWFGAVIAW